MKILIGYDGSKSADAAIATAGKLPSVSWVYAPHDASEHRQHE